MYKLVYHYLTNTKNKKAILYIYFGINVRF